MNTSEKERVAELQETIAHYSRLLKQSKNHLAKFPNCKSELEFIAKYESVITRAKAYIQAVAA
jgi:hypothetical protein